jgi:ribonuclease HI
MTNNFKINEDKCLYVYTDGAVSGTPGPAGSGVVFIQDSKIIYKISEPIGVQTNNYAELMAIKIALDTVKEYPNQRIILTSDSKYALGSICENWNAKKNISLIRKIKRLKNKFSKLTFKHCRGHSGIFGNEQADICAVQGKRMNKKE